MRRTRCCLRSSRRTLHERVARVLLSDFSARAALQPELVAHHFTEAAQTVEAVQQWQQAGMQSLQHSASIEAIAQLKRRGSRIDRRAACITNAFLVRARAAHHTWRRLREH